MEVYVRRIEITNSGDSHYVLFMVWLILRRRLSRNPALREPAHVYDLCPLSHPSHTARSLNSSRAWTCRGLSVRDDPIVSVVLGTYNRLPFLKTTIKSVRHEVASISHEITVVDGGSTDGTLPWLVTQKDITAIVQHNHGTWRGRAVERRSWGHFMNLGFKCAQGKFILMISDDCLLVPDSIANGVRQFETMLAAGRKVGAVAFYWRNWPEQEDYWVGLTLGDKMFVNHGLFLRSAVANVGWIEEDIYHFYHADGDLCLKLWEAGWEVVDCPDAFVEHCLYTSPETREIGVSTQPADWQAYLKRWSGVFYDPNTHNIGGWLHRSFQDAHDTVKNFPRRSLLILATRKAKAFLIVAARKATHSIRQALQPRLN